MSQTSLSVQNGSLIPYGGGSSLPGTPDREPSDPIIGLSPLSSFHSPAPSPPLPPTDPDSSYTASPDLSLEWTSTSSVQAPFQCTDFNHCGAISDPTGAFQCDPNNVTRCPGLPPGFPTPVSFNLLNHPEQTNVDVCSHCIQHDTIDPRYLPSKLAVVQRPATEHARTGHRAQLCTRCIRDEVELYWDRQRRPMPANPGFTVQLVTQWPNLGGIQDLCICPLWAIQLLANTCCHACREDWFWHQSYNPSTQNEDMLRTRTEPVIQGRKRCILNGGNAQHAVSAATIAERQAQLIGRMCPCGERPKTPNAPEYISVCLGCMGVRIDPNRLPPEYSFQAVDSVLQRKGRSRGPLFRPTKGPRREARSPNFRVNIERAWIHPDDYDDWVGDN